MNKYSFTIFVKLFGKGLEVELFITGRISNKICARKFSEYRFSKKIKNATDDLIIFAN